MSFHDEKKGTVQNLANRGIFWDVFLGPVYNRLMPVALTDAYREFMSEVKPRNNSRVLDVGSGPGALCLMVAEEFPTVSITGIDYSRTEVRAAERLRNKRRVENCRFLRGDAMSLPFDDDTFDTVMSFASIKHWPDKVQGLKEIKRVLATGGRAIIVEIDADCAEEEFNRFISRFYSWWVYKRLMRWFGRKITIEQGLSAGNSESLASSAGFDRITVNKVKDWPFLLFTLEDSGTAIEENGGQR